MSVSQGYLTFGCLLESKNYTKARCNFNIMVICTDMNHNASEAINLSLVSTILNWYWDDLSCLHKIQNVWITGHHLCFSDNEEPILSTDLCGYDSLRMGLQEKCPYSEYIKIHFKSTGPPVTSGFYGYFHVISKGRRTSISLSISSHVFVAVHIVLQCHMISPPGKACEGAPPLLSTGSKVVISVVVIRKYTCEFNLSAMRLKKKVILN